MANTYTDGWALPRWATCKWHYFRNGTSLCKRHSGLSGEPVLIPSYRERCQECLRRLERAERKGGVA